MLCIHPIFVRAEQDFTKRNSMKLFGLLSILALNLIFASISLSAEDRERSPHRRQPTPTPISSKPSSSIQLSPVETLMGQQESQPLPSDQPVESTQSISPAAVSYNINMDSFDAAPLPPEETSNSQTSIESTLPPEEPILQVNGTISSEEDISKMESEVQQHENDPAMEIVQVDPIAPQTPI
jgi:hypothetical protein